MVKIQFFFHLCYSSELSLSRLLLADCSGLLKGDSHLPVTESTISFEVRW